MSPRPRLVIDGAVLGDVSLVMGVAGVAYTQELSASGGDGTYAWSLSAGTLPRGLALSVGGSIGGTPTDTGTTRFSVRVASAGQTADVALSLTVRPRLAILQAAIPIGVTGQPYRVQLTATTGAGPVTWHLARGRLPSGITLTADGLLAGTPNGPDSSLVTIEARAGLQLTSASLAVVSRPLESLVLQLSVRGHVFNVLSDSRRFRQFAITTGSTLRDSALYVALSPDVPSDSLNAFGGNVSAASVQLREVVAAPTDTLAAYQRARLEAPSHTVPYQAAARAPADSQLFCANYFGGGTCSYGTLVLADDYYAYYEDRELPAGGGNSPDWYQEVARWNRYSEPILRRIWGLPSDVDGNRRINIFVTNKIGLGGFMWNNCVGPGPVDLTQARDSWTCLRSAVQEVFNAGPMNLVTATTGLRSSAGFFALAQTTDAQEYVLWTQGSRFSGTRLWAGTWQSDTYSRRNNYRGGWDPTLGNGVSNMVRYILTKAVDTLPDGTNIGGYFQADGWRFSCLATLRSCRVHSDTYVTPGMFSYWLWQHFGDGIGDRYTRANFGDYYGDVWEQAVGLRGAHLFNMFFLSTVLDDTPLGAASTLEWPENPVPAKLPGVRSQMHQLSLGSAGTYFALYSGPQVIRIGGLRPNSNYVLDVEFLGSSRTALTMVRP